MTLVWAAGGLLGALPYWCSGVLPDFTDAVFESVSGFTTTGVSVIADVEAVSRPLLFWRALTHWLGGMGIVALFLALLPLFGAGAGQLFQAESPGPDVDRTSARITGTAKNLWLIYLVLTAVQAALLMLCGMDWFDAATHAFSTIATGGFTVRNRSIAAYNSPAIEWVCIVFMFLSAFNFTLIFRFLRGKARDICVNSEARAYCLIILTAAAVCSVCLVPGSGGAGVRRALFQVLSVISTTGFAAADMTQWPQAAQACLFILMFVGGCSSSTAGGVKVVRHVILFKQMGNEMKRLLNPGGVFVIRLDNKPGRRTVVYGAAAFVFLYLTVTLFATLTLAAVGIEVFPALNLALLSLGNIGTGLGTADYGAVIRQLPQWVKWFLCFLMVAGRLELWTVFALFSREWWKK
ncbi:MAG: Trk system potassium uptake protein TrkH [Treponematales bacterium]